MRDRASVFVPRNPPRIEFEHRGVEFIKPRRETADTKNADEAAVVHRVHFIAEMVSKLKSQASLLAGGLVRDTSTPLKLAVNGRQRHPEVPEGYAGNVVLWARPAATARCHGGKQPWGKSLCSAGRRSNFKPRSLKFQSGFQIFSKSGALAHKTTHR